MTDPLVEQLVKKRDHAVQQIQDVKDTALDSGEDLTDDQLEAVETYKRSIDGYDRQLAAIGHDLDMDSDVRQKLARIAPAGTDGAAPQYRNAGELVWDLLHQGDTDAQRRYRAAKKRAAEHIGTLAADTTPTAGDLDGAYIDPVVGPIIRPDYAGMPFTSALGLRQMPSGSVFERPYVVDASFADGVDVQTLQKAEVASKTFSIESDALKRTTIAGYINISQQTLTWHPNSLAIIVQQLRDRLAWRVERFMVAELANSTGKVILADAADGPTTVQAIYDASAEVFAQTNMLATWILMGPTGFARLGGLTDLGGRPLLPTVSPQNAVGTARADTFNMGGVAGLNAIVSPAITDDTFWVGNGVCMEAYGYQYPLLQAVEPSVLGQQVAVGGDYVAHRPTPYANGAVHIAPV